MSSPLPDRVAVDSPCFIYLLEGSTAERNDFLAAELAGFPGRRLLTSALTLTEILVKPHREGTSE